MKSKRGGRTAQSDSGAHENHLMYRRLLSLYKRPSMPPRVGAAGASTKHITEEHREGNGWDRDAQSAGALLREAAPAGLLIAACAFALAGPIRPVRAIILLRGRKGNEGRSAKKQMYNLSLCSVIRASQREWRRGRPMPPPREVAAAAGASAPAVPRGGRPCGP